MSGSLNILGMIYNGRKVVFLAPGVIAVLWGLALMIRGYYHDWHVKPILALEEKLEQFEKDLNSTRSTLQSCEEDKKVKVFVTQNNSVFNNLREVIKEVESEADVSDEFNKSNYDWMYQ